jgi:hypothetical protein
MPVGHNFERDPPKDHLCPVWFNLVQGFQRRRFKYESLRRTTDGCQLMAKAHLASRCYLQLFVGGCMSYLRYLCLFPHNMLCFCLTFRRLVYSVASFSRLSFFSPSIFSNIYFLTDRLL